ncbi:hypothetical protein D9756_006328 [Leucocoprinus leucothites]|uniref:DUF7888 domain-containing protein n=1 Tax=Leucocoprinus leucothites TaxID=201217 RepID=A0A8H5D3A0_9AGAR|nr:hypothetical protein D9756_006328 [Leucoagaricus leucothites]
MRYSPVLHLWAIAVLSAISISALPTLDLTIAPLVGRGESIESTLNARKNDGHVSKSYKPTIKVPRDGHVPVSYKPTIKVPRDYIDPGLYARVISDLDVRFESDHYSRLASKGELEIYDGRSFDLVERQFGNTSLGQEIVDVIKGIVKLIKDKVKQDNHAREKFTKETVANGRQKFPHFNWAICHVKHDEHFDGDRGKDWGHSHHEVDIQIGGTIGYEIYWFRSGWFHREGDGGFINWAYSGFTESVSKDGSKVVFKRPP